MIIAEDDINTIFKASCRIAATEKLIMMYFELQADPTINFSYLVKT